MKRVIFLVFLILLITISFISAVCIGYPTWQKFQAPVMVKRLLLHTNANLLSMEMCVQQLIILNVPG